MSQKQQNSVWGSLKALDAFPKVNEDFFQRTMSGGIITIVASVFMFILFMSEARKSRCERLKWLGVQVWKPTSVLLPQGCSSQHKPAMS